MTTKFYNEYRGSHHGQQEFSLHLLKDNKSVGYIDYSVFEDIPYIEMIKVPEKTNTRKGYATALIRHLQSLFPDTEINVGFTSAPGDKFFATIPKRVIDNPEYHSKLERLNQLRSRLAQYQRKADEIYAKHDFTDTNKDWLGSIDWNRIHDEVDDLEHELHRMKPNKRIFEAGKPASTKILSEAELSKRTQTQTIDSLYAILRKKYGNPIGYGTTRYAFSNGKFVFKLPKNNMGFMENENEAERYKSGYWLKQHLLAKCKLIYVGGIPVLVMEFVKQIPYKEMPDWADFIDCGQVGYNRRGNIVAYDYGN